MDHVINNVMEQNELLLEMLLEVQQTAADRTTQLHSLLQKSASKSYEVAKALSSYELEAKKFANQSIPSFVQCADWMEQINSHIDSLQHENSQLKLQNKRFFESVQLQNTELMQYKCMVYRLIASNGPEATCTTLSQRYALIVISIINSFIVLVMMTVKLSIWAIWNLHRADPCLK